MEVTTILALLVACQLVCDTTQLDAKLESNAVTHHYGSSKANFKYKTYYFEEPVSATSILSTILMIL